MGIFTKGMKKALEEEQVAWCTESWQRVLYKGRWEWLASRRLPLCSCPPKVRGVLQGARQLARGEEEELVSSLQGEWFVVSQEPLEQILERVRVQGTSCSASSGVKEDEKGGADLHLLRRWACVPSSTEDGRICFQFQFMRGPEGDLYCDRYGAVIREQREGELLFSNAFGLPVLWQRSWRKNQLSPSKSSQLPPQLGAGHERVLGAGHEQVLGAGLDAPSALFFDRCGSGDSIHSNPWLA